MHWLNFFLYMLLIFVNTHMFFSRRDTSKATNEELLKDLEVCRGVMLKQCDLNHIVYMDHQVAPRRTFRILNVFTLAYFLTMLFFTLGPVISQPVLVCLDPPLNVLTQHAEVHHM